MEYKKKKSSKLYRDFYLYSGIHIFYFSFFFVVFKETFLSHPGNSNNKKKKSYHSIYIE